MGVVKFNNDESESIFVEKGFYGTSHSRNGVLCLLSSMTINDCLSGCIQFVGPLVDEDEADQVVENLLQVLRTIE